MRRLSVLCLLLLFDAAMLATHSQAKNNAKLTYVDVHGYPDNPAIVDKDGKLTKAYLKRASGISNRDKSRYAYFPLKLHNQEQVCESRGAEIYPNGAGYLIIELSSFFPATLGADGKPFCDPQSKAMGNVLSAPSLDLYLAALWARQAIRDEVIAKAGAVDDPLCVKGSYIACPEPENRGKRFDAYRLWYIKKCRPAKPGCVKLMMSYHEERSARYTVSEHMDFDVRFETGKALRERKLIDFVTSQSLPPGPLGPGPLRVIGPSSGNH
jgi:hypothetical protein